MLVYNVHQSSPVSRIVIIKFISDVVKSAKVSVTELSLLTMKDNHINI
jgi:hypothetical protein